MYATVIFFSVHLWMPLFTTDRKYWYVKVDGLSDNTSVDSSTSVDRPLILDWTDLFQKCIHSILQNIFFCDSNVCPVILYPCLLTMTNRFCKAQIIVHTSLSESNVFQTRCNSFYTQKSVNIWVFFTVIRPTIDRMHICPTFQQWSSTFKFNCLISHAIYSHYITTSM